LDVAGRIAWRRELNARLRFGLAAMGLILLAGIAGWYSVKPEPIASGSTTTFIAVDGGGVTFTVPPGSFLDHLPVKPLPVTDPELIEAFRSAIKAWTESLGGKLPIRYPRLVKQQDDSGFCAMPWLAYADMEMNRVVFCRLEDGDAETVMLHEVAHLLGVPHIIDDDLMNPMIHHQKLRTPSPAAIALARLAHPTKAD